MNLKPILQAILEDYALPLNGAHGVAHWARVLENGLRLTEETGANVEVVSLFAILHDSRRINDVADPEHGPRAAEFAVELRGSVIDPEDHEFRLLYACVSADAEELAEGDMDDRAISSVYNDRFQRT